jgi:PAS domain S-box-containing protein
MMLRSSEDKFSKLFYSSPDAILLMELQSGKVIDVNGRFEKLFGYSRDELLGRPVHAFDMYSPAERQRFVSMMQELGMVDDVEFGLRDKAGNTIIVTASAELIDIDQVQHALTILHDITERRQTEEALRQAQKSQSIATLAGGIAHDFNNLLNAVLGQSTLALGKLSPESPAGGNISKAIKAAERAADLTRQLLAYSGKGKFLIEDIDLNTFIKENVQMLEVSIPKTAQLRFTFGTPAPVIRGDMGQLQQVVMNLIINAGEAMDTDPGFIDIRTDQVRVTQGDSEYWKYTGSPLQTGMYALVQISDTGQGMKPEVQARIFEPFFSAKFVGRGLGLAAVLGVVKGHRGGIRVASEEGRGTRFDVVFPIVESSSRANAPSEKITPAVQGKGKTVLVIDDELSVLELLTDILTEAHFTVIGSPNPVDGIDLYRRHRQDIAIVILDYSMPGMDGKTAFGKLLELNEDVKVLLCSGYAEEQMESSFGDMRPADFIHKPYKPTALLERISSVLSD